MTDRTGASEPGGGHGGAERDGVKDIAASVRARLTNRARELRRPFQEVLTHFALERLLYRLSRSRHAGRFVLKGGLLLRAWEAPQSRPTRDADLLGTGNPSVEAMVNVMREVCAMPVEPDGVRFDPESVRGARTRPEEDYQGVQLHVVGYLGQSRTVLKVDVGFGDTVVPGPIDVAYPTLLALPPPRLQGYTRESVVAEKLQAMVALGEINTRFKDFYDVWFLARSFAVDPEVLGRAIGTTFARRRTALPREPVSLTDSFARDATRRTQWQAFLRRTGIEDAPRDFTDVVAALRQFLLPVVAALVEAAEPAAGSA